MAKGRDRQTVSMWFWLFSMIVMIIPLVNIIMTLVWAFTGENESRKNYFKAAIVFFFLMIGVGVLVASIGFVPPLLHQWKMPSK